MPAIPLPQQPLSQVNQQKVESNIRLVENWGKSSTEDVKEVAEIVTVAMRVMEQAFATGVVEYALYDRATSLIGESEYPAAILSQKLLQNLIIHLETCVDKKTHIQKIHSPPNRRFNAPSTRIQPAFQSSHLRSPLINTQSAFLSPSPLPEVVKIEDPEIPVIEIEDNGPAPEKTGPPTVETRPPAQDASRTGCGPETIPVEPRIENDVREGDITQSTNGGRATQDVQMNENEESQRRPNNAIVNQEEIMTHEEKYTLLNRKRARENSGERSKKGVNEGVEEREETPTRTDTKRSARVSCTNFGYSDDFKINLPFAITSRMNSPAPSGRLSSRESTPLSTGKKGIRSGKLEFAHRQSVERRNALEMELEDEEMAEEPVLDTKRGKENVMGGEKCYKSTRTVDESPHEHAEGARNDEEERIMEDVKPILPLIIKKRRGRPPKKQTNVTSKQAPKPKSGERRRSNVHTKKKEDLAASVASLSPLSSGTYSDCGNSQLLPGKDKNTPDAKKTAIWRVSLSPAPRSSAFEILQNVRNNKGRRPPMRSPSPRPDEGTGKGAEMMNTPVFKGG